jgi:hypothetical protein
LQYENALTARKIWLGLRPQPLAPEEKTWLDAGQGRWKAPPVVEALTALTYLPDGVERPWTSTLINLLLWVGAGWFLFDLGKRLGGGPAGALTGLAFYLLVPFGILVSRSFQHEAVMVAGFLGALWYLVHFDAVRDSRRSILAGFLSGLAVLLKPGVTLFPLAAAHVGQSLRAHGLRRTLQAPALYLSLLLIGLPSVAYFLVFLRGETHQLLPHLLLTPGYYRGVALNIGRVVGWLPMAAALAGAVLLLCIRSSPLGVSLLLGFGAYLALFSYAAMTHDYYLTLLIPIVALCLCPVAQLFFAGLSWKRPRAWLTAAILAGAVLYSFDFFQRVREGTQRAGEGFWLRVSQETRSRIGPGCRVLVLSPVEYGNALRWHAWLIAQVYPSRADKRYEELQGLPDVSDAERLRRLIEEFRPSYFVIASLKEFEEQPELAAALDARSTRIHESNVLIIYDLRPRAP